MARTQLCRPHIALDDETQNRGLALAGLLLAYMLGRVSDRAAELAAIADRARVAGLTCERIYDGLSK
ncbi:DUF2514 family protein [Bordetella avium]|uniref:DUF2514 family protein n=1 Tax=Bordetella avium TaxID=521 RepID=UPI0023EA4FD4|nr:DUF2514 family protein [Bordetella avium]